MNNLKYLLTSLLGLAIASVETAWSAPLTEAELTRVYHEVSMVDPGAGKRPAVVHDVVKGNLAVETGLESRAELLFPDNTLTRLASNTYFSFKTGTREMDLGHGAILFQIPHGVGGAKINTAAITAAITGTTGFVEHVGNTFKLVLLEGTVRVYLNDRVRESMMVHGGQMLIAPSNAHTMKDWQTVDFDVAKMMKSSTLLKPGLFKPLPPEAMNRITEVINTQSGKIAGGELNSTNLVIAGGVSTVLLVDNNMRNRFSNPPTKQSSKGTPTPTPTATATPTPTATPSPTSTPLPTPNPSPTPNPNPTPSGSPTPPPPVGYTTDNTTVVVTNNTTPTITTQGVTSPGVLYKDVMTNGSPSAFLFGATSAFDNAMNFDNIYGQYVKPSAVFVFDSLQLGGMTFQVNQGINSVTLVGNLGITNTPGTTIDLGGINSLLLATQAGNITLDSGISFTTSSNQPTFFGLYARGGDLTTGSTFNLAPSNLTFAAEDNADFTATAVVTAKNVNITGLTSVQFDGTANTTQVFQINGGDVEVGGSVTANQGAFLYGTSATINGSMNVKNLTAAVTGDFLLNTSGSITTASDAKTTITTGGDLTLNGTVSTHQAFLTATGAITLGGTVTTNDILSATSATATVNGALNLAKADFETSGDFTLSGTGVITTSQSAVINANGGGITLDGALAGNQVTLTATGDIAINQAITSNQLLITGKSVAFGTDLALTGSNNELTATNGDINAAGHQLSGFDQVSVSNGDFTAGGLSANTLIVNQTGSVNVANNLNLQHAFTGLGAVTVGGLFTAPTITAGDITAGALQTNTVMSSGTLTLGSSNLVPLTGNTVTITAPTVSFLAGAAMNGLAGTSTTGPGNGLNLTINTGTFTLGAGLSLNGGDGNAARTDAGGNGGTLNITSSDSITQNAPILVTTGQNSQGGSTGGNGGTVNLTAANTVALNDRIEVSSNSGKRLSNSGGHINVTSNKLSGTAINVGSTAQLLALLNSAAPGGGGGSITFVSAGGDINVNGATMQADRGTIDIHNNGVSGIVAIDNANLNASTVKAGALGNNGTLNVGGGTMSADSIIHLYAGGSNGTVNFTNDVTLGGNSLKTIAANTVTIFNGVIVTVNGSTPASVFTNNANYTGFGGNASTTGTFSGQGATTHLFSAAHGGY